MINALLCTARNALPKNFSSHQHRVEWIVEAKLEDVWQWLNTPETFTEGQVFPWKVEFIAPEGNSAADFQPGVICAHHGPGMMFAGVIGEVEKPRYRDLQYYYGSYALTFRLIRPIRLQFWTEAVDETSCKVTLQVDSYVRDGFGWLWTAAQSVFWRLFPRAVKRGIASV